MKFTPPYIFAGLYERERRIAIEAPNRATVAAIFKRRDRQRELERRERVDYENHLEGIHTYGFCRWCGPKYFYD
jgi:hypothetical protein